jgi:excinuclease ABC subunit C
VDALSDFLDGRTKPVVRRLEAGMNEAAAAEEFERAARLRDQLINVRKVIERQQMVSSTSEDLDVIGMAEDELEAAIQVFFVRKGRVTGRKGYIVDKVEEVDTPTLVARFIEQLYADGDVPKQVLVPVEPTNTAFYEQWLSQVRGSNVAVRVPQRGEKRALAQTVSDNAREAFGQHRLKRSSDFSARARQLRQLQQEIGMGDAPLRIECFDISNTGPTEAVGSMVVFEDGLPKRSDYRRFAIRWKGSQDDFANMGEVIHRRFARYLQEQEDDGRTRKFAYPPNLVVIDGGKGQLNRAVEVMGELGIHDVTVISLAKRMEEVFLPGEMESIFIPRGSEALYLLQRIRDEAHRFALTYHRQRRAKKMTHSILDDVPGLGPARRKVLMKHFGSVKKMRLASLEEIEAVQGIPRKVAQDLHQLLHDPADRKAS